VGATKLAARSETTVPLIEYRALAEQTCSDGEWHYAERRILIARFAWAIPCEKALLTIEDYAPIIEIGAGSGYWAFLLRQMGVDVVAYDHKPGGNRGAWHTHRWSPVLVGSAGKARLHPDRALFLCWPPYKSSFAYDALCLYQGRTILYVGEGRGGCTADDAFHGELAKNWDEVETVDLPQWPGVHDYLNVWRKK
jgi:hypothetical protein